VQRAELFDDQEPEDDDRAAGIQEILPSLPQAHAAQGSEIKFVIGNRVICKFKPHQVRMSAVFQITNYKFQNYKWLQGRKLNG
jgi:hypothetical protein